LFLRPGRVRFGPGTVAVAACKQGFHLPRYQAMGGMQLAAPSSAIGTPRRQVQKVRPSTAPTRRSIPRFSPRRSGTTVRSQPQSRHRCHRRAQSLRRRSAGSEGRGRTEGAIHPLESISQRTRRLDHPPRRPDRHHQQSMTSRPVTQSSGHFPEDDWVQVGTGHDGVGALPRGGPDISPEGPYGVER
jgi:hypothetical protein